jgi:hypothetical protein
MARQNVIEQAAIQIGTLSEIFTWSLAWHAFATLRDALLAGAIGC